MWVDRVRRRVHVGRRAARRPPAIGGRVPDHARDRADGRRPPSACGRSPCGSRRNRATCRRSPGSPPCWSQALTTLAFLAASGFLLVRFPDGRHADRLSALVDILVVLITAAVVVQAFAPGPIERELDRGDGQPARDRGAGIARSIHGSAQPGSCSTPRASSSPCSRSSPATAGPTRSSARRSAGWRRPGPCPSRSSRSSSSRTGCGRCGTCRRCCSRSRSASPCSATACSTSTGSSAARSRTPSSPRSWPGCSSS